VRYKIPFYGTIKIQIARSDVLYNESLEFQSFGIGKNTVFHLGAGTYYLAFNPAVNEMGEKVLSSGILD
jgi:hypothetical protein